MSHKYTVKDVVKLLILNKIKLPAKIILEKNKLSNFFSLDFDIESAHEKDSEEFMISVNPNCNDSYIFHSFTSEITYMCNFCDDKILFFISLDNEHNSCCK